MLSIDRIFFKKTVYLGKNKGSYKSQLATNGPKKKQHVMEKSLQETLGEFH